jgi:trimethylamine--corrinoid protein Co-methyltransferase
LILCKIGYLAQLAKCPEGHAQSKAVMTESRNIVWPTLQVLHPEQIRDVHQYSLQILETTGIRVESPEALEIFRKSGSIRLEGNIVYIHGDLIETSIHSAPSNVEVYNKAGEHAFHLGKKQGRDTHFGIGVTNTWYQEAEGGKVVPFTRKHMFEASRLGEKLENFAMLSTPGVLSDVPVDKADLYATLDMYAGTQKPLVLLISGAGKLEPVLELLAAIHGDLSHKPFCLPYVNPITPLVLNGETADKMISSIRHGLPLMYSNYGMYGGSTPITEGGTLALLNAELLAGLVFSQLIKEGSPIILGSLPAAFNMSTMGSYYTPGSYLLNLACAEMMDFYGIPHCGTSGSNNGRDADLPAAENLWLNHLSSCLGKVGCVPFVGGNLESLAFSPSTVVLSNHIIGEARKFTGGFNLDETSVNLEEIRQVGHGGNYFTSEQTLLAAADSLSNSKPLWETLSLESWKAQGMPSARKELIELTQELCSRAQIKSEEDREVILQGEQFINNLPG